MTAARIGLTLSGDTIPLGMFIEAARNFRTLLSELDVSISGSRNLEWIISDLSVGSAVLAVAPSLLNEEAIDRSPIIISAALAGMETIEKTAEWPLHFTDEALVKAKELVGLINSHVERISLFGNTGQGETKRIRVTQRIAANVDQLIGPSSFALGSVEGTLETLTIHGGNWFNLYDVISLRRIRCYCTREVIDELSDDLGKRVLAKGEVKFNMRGQPISVKLKDYKVFGNKRLPHVKDIRGLFAKNKIDTEELSDSLRN